MYFDFNCSHITFCINLFIINSIRGKKYNGDCRDYFLAVNGSEKQNAYYVISLTEMNPYENRRKLSFELTIVVRNRQTRILYQKTYKYFRQAIKILHFCERRSIMLRYLRR